MTEAATQTRFRVEGMDCAGCATKIDTAVRRLPGIADVTVSVTAAPWRCVIRSKATRRPAKEGDRARLWNRAIYACREAGRDGGP